MLILGLLYFVFKFGVRIGLDALVLKKHVRFLMLSSAAALYFPSVWNALL